MAKIQKRTCITFEDRNLNSHQELVIWSKNLKLFIKLSKNLKRTISNSLVEVVVIHKQDGRVVPITSFLLLFVPRNIHLSTRFTSLLKLTIRIFNISIPHNYDSFQILHALGLLHEHQRPDRDQYIDVDMDAVTAHGFQDHLKKACFLKFEFLINYDSKRY